MATKNYLTDIKSYKRRFMANVSLTVSRGFTPNYTGSNSFISDETCTWTFDLTNLNIEELSVSGAEYTWNSPVLVLSNATNDNVVVSVVCASTDLCILSINGHQGGETNKLAAYPNGGTIAYVNKYNENVTVNIADFGLYYSWSPQGMDYKLSDSIDDILTGTKLTIKNVSVYLYAYQSTSRVSDLRITNNINRTVYDSVRTYSGYSGQTVSKTFTYNIDVVQKYHDVQSSRTWDVLISSTYI